jgi:GT2 family glycosyltransferase
MKPSLSIIIPTYNGSRTIGLCLEAIFAHSDPDCEVIVVDDCSTDNSRDIIRNYPCRFIQLEKHAGASAARNAGALASSGESLFFIDADCLLQDDTLSRVRKNIAEHTADTVIGGTYTPVPQEPNFFDLFQSVFVNYSETRNPLNPDYIAAHALVIRADVFRRIGGFAEDFLPILEDVEFCHRLRRAGHSLIMDPYLQVRHSFNFTLRRSMRNAVRKASYWIQYSLSNSDLLADSGTASWEMKSNGIGWLLTMLAAGFTITTGSSALPATIPFLWGANIMMNRGLFKALARAGGMRFAIIAGSYYMMLYPAAVWTGALKGVARHLFQKKKASWVQRYD